MKLFTQKYIKIGETAVSFFIILTFFFSTILPSGNSYAQQISSSTILNLPIPGTMIPVSSGFTPTLIKGLSLHAENPLLFDFIIDTGDSDLEGDALEVESEKLIKYFLASLTVPEKEMWVNLSPYEQDRIIPQKFGSTEMGRDLLAQDYMLKQLTASLMYPENKIGENFWDRVYEKTQERFGTTEIPINTFNKVWIVPEDAVVFEHDGGAVILESRLKVMLEEDYLALERNLNSKKFGTDQLEQKDVETLSGVSSAVVREILIPEIEREVNEGKSFAKLRQVYNSMILATWYKQNLKESLLGQVYVDQNKTKGIDLEDKQINKKIYDQYVEAFKKGVYNYTREDFDPATQQIIPRKYFSGGYSQENPVKGFLSEIVADDALGISKVEKLTVKHFIELAGTPGLENNKEILEAMRTKVRTFTPDNQRRILAALNGKKESHLKVVQSLFLEDTDRDKVRKASSSIDDSRERRKIIIDNILGNEGVSLTKDLNEIRGLDQAFILMKLFRETKDEESKIFLKDEFKRLFEEKKDEIVFRRQKQLMFLFLLSRVESNLAVETESFKGDILWAGESLLENLSEADENIGEKINFISGVFLKFNFLEELRNIKNQVRDSFIKELLEKSISSFDKKEKLNLRRYWFKFLLEEMDVRWFEYRKREESFLLTRGNVDEKFSSYLRSVVVEERASDFLNKLREGQIEPQTLVNFWMLGENGEKKIVQKAVVGQANVLLDLLYKSLVLNFSPGTMVSYETVPDISHNPLQERIIEYFSNKKNGKVSLKISQSAQGEAKVLKNFKYGRYNFVFFGWKEKLKDMVIRVARNAKSTRIEDVHAFFVLFQLGIGPEVFYWGETKNQYYYEITEEIKGLTLAEYSRELRDQEIQKILAVLTVLIQNGIHVEDAFRNPANIIIGKASNSDEDRAYIIDPGGLRMQGKDSYEFLAREYRHEMASGGYSDQWKRIDPNSKIDSYLRQIQEQGSDALMEIQYEDSNQAVSSPVKRDRKRSFKSKYGGINLDPNLLNLQIKRDGNGVPLPVWEQPIDQMNIEGFLPIIINIKMFPVNNMSFLLGFIDKKEPEESGVGDISLRDMPVWFTKKQDIGPKLT